MNFSEIWGRIHPLAITKSFSVRHSSYCMCVKGINKENKIKNRLTKTYRLSATVLTVKLTRWSPFVCVCIHILKKKTAKKGEK